MRDSFSPLAGRYLAADANLRQTVCHALVARALAMHLPEPPARIADIGGGAGQQAIPLARSSHEVTVLDTSPKMLGEARRRLEAETSDTRDRVRLVEGAGESAPGLFGKSAFDAVLCHGVLMYLEDPRDMIRSLANLVRPGGIVSVLAKNASALAARPALEGRYREALGLIGADRAPGRLGVVTRGDTIEGLSEACREVGLVMERWYGVRTFTDHLGDAPPGHDLPDVLELEWEAGERDPYRSVSRLIHVLARKPTNHP